jgi:hypothetical protein
MNRDTGSLELAHARIGARWGARPDEALWRRIETTRDLDAMLALARGSALGWWLGALDAGAGLHRIERTLRERWRERIAEVAGWMPAAWQEALRWCARLIDLPALQPWAPSQALPAWADAGSPPADAAVLLRRWLVQWRLRLPRADGREAIERQLVPLVERHLRAFAAPGAADGWALRRALQERLVLLWRRHPAEPVGAFVYLGLSALELERLRGEITRRAAFPLREPAA